MNLQEFSFPDKDNRRTSSIHKDIHVNVIAMFAMPFVSGCGPCLREQVMTLE